MDYLQLSTTELEKQTGVDRYKWGNLRNKENLRANEEHLEGIKKIAPEFIYWVVTGQELPAAGQIKPSTKTKR